MNQAPFVLLFVDDPAASAGFYRRLLGCEPIETSPTFAMFPLPGGAKLGLWSRRTAEPTPTGEPGSAELAFPVGSEAEVETVHRAWQDAAVPGLASPARLDFGLTFTGLDPDGHRLRVFCPGEG